MANVANPWTKLFAAAAAAATSAGGRIATLTLPGERRDLFAGVSQRQNAPYTPMASISWSLTSNIPSLTPPAIATALTEASR